MPETSWVKYTVRKSRRARRVILSISVSKGLEVVIPVVFGLRGIPKVLDSKRDWIEREMKRVAAEAPLTAPSRIDLQAIESGWQVAYRNGSGNRFTASETNENQVVVQGDTLNVLGVAAVLRTWLHSKAHAHLVPWLRDVSEEIGAPFKKTMVRGQKTRWASCSRRQTISLNRNLLFLPGGLVRHIFLHELCHLRRMDHSPAFWRLVGELEPDYRRIESEVKLADCHVPPWAQPQ